MTSQIAALSGASRATRTDRIQTLWSGYGEVVRYELTEADQPSVVVKHVKPPKGTGRSHDRKLRSYEVERTWYRDWAASCSSRCRIPRPLHVQRSKAEWLFVLEDLDASGFATRSRSLSRGQQDACLGWLAQFHATFLGRRPKGLWKVGTYWHLRTRPEEHASMPPGALRNGASTIDQRLSNAQFQTFVHGDAKPANFCFSHDGHAVAAVDFQYVGGGCGMKDVAYLLTGEGSGVTQRALDVYFRILRAALADTDVDAAAVEREWRALFPWACADFQRFLAGWAPDRHPHAYAQSLTQGVLRQLS